MPYPALPSPASLSAEVSLTHLKDSAFLPCSPPAIPQPGIPLPSTGSSRGEFPGFLGTTEMLRLPAAYPASLGRLRSAVPSSRFLFAPDGQKRITVGLRSACSPGHPSPGLSDGDDRTSQVPERPHARVPCSPTPVGPSRQAIYSACRCCLPPR